MSRFDRPGFRPWEEKGLKKTTGKNEKFQPRVTKGMKPFAFGFESEVYTSALEFPERGKKMPGLVYKKFDFDTYVDPETLKIILDTVLRKWDRVKKVKKELQDRGEPGFNIPKVVRGYYNTTETGAEAGVIMSDLREGGAKTIIDVKDLDKFKEFIRKNEWQKIKAAVLRDTEIGRKHGINFNSPVIADAWLVARDQKTGDCEVFLSDIGGYVTVYEGGRTPEQGQAMEDSQKKIAGKLNEIERKMGYE